MIPLPMFSGLAYIMARVGDEIGFDADDLAALYGVAGHDLEQYLRDLAPTPIAAFQRVIGDADALRVGYRHFESTDTYIAALQSAFAHFEFAPPVPAQLGAGGTGWLLASEQTPALAERALQIANTPADPSDQLAFARRLARIAFWNRPELPSVDAAFRDRVVDVCAYLVEYTAIL